MEKMPRRDARDTTDEISNVLNWDLHATVVKRTLMAGRLLSWRSFIVQTSGKRLPSATNRLAVKRFHAFTLYVTGREHIDPNNNARQS